MSSENRYAFEVVDGRAIVGNSDLAEQWERLNAQHCHQTSLYSSPAWLAHLAESSDARLRVWFARDSSGRLAGVVPVSLGTWALNFDISNRVLLRREVQAAHILGSVPLLPPSAQIYHDFVAHIFRECDECDCLYVDSVPTDSHFWQFLQGRDVLPRSSRLHIVDGPRPWHLVQLDTSFDAYLKMMSSKARANIRRQIRRFDGTVAGGLQLSRCIAPEQVGRFLESAARVSQRSWQHRTLGERISSSQERRRRFEDLAARGLLRCYLLQVGDTPCAFVVGYQYSNTYQYVEIGFDEAFREHSPGKILLYMILEDLHTHNRPETLNFGIGDATYKRRFGNCERQDVSCLIVRNRIRNRLLMAGHALFTRAVNSAKRVVGRKVTK